MRKLIKSLAAAAVFASPLACDLEKTGNQLQADKVMVATILSTPPVELSALGLAGLDAGVPLDGDAGVVTVPPQTAAFVFFGEREFRSLDVEPTPVTGATASVRAEGAQPVMLEAGEAGTYALTSAEDEKLEYASGANYLFEVQYGGQTYVGRVDQAPQLEQIVAFHPSSGYVEHAANTPFTFSRPAAPANQERNLGFITVFPVSQSGERGEPTWTNVPHKPLDFLKLVALPSKWKEDSVTIPASAFPQKDQTYLVVLQAVKLGGPESHNLFTGSALLAGTAEVGVFRTK
ncbi:MAG: hypothetical protein WBV82_17170 [Myxococcaceae bacterium]